MRSAFAVENMSHLTATLPLATLRFLAATRVSANLVALHDLLLRRGDGDGPFLDFCHVKFPHFFGSTREPHSYLIRPARIRCRIPNLS